MEMSSSRDRLEKALHRIADPGGEGIRACPTVYADAARMAADAADARTRFGISLGPLDGAIVTIKDLFDVAGEPTRAGSKVLAEEALPAEKDAAIVRRLRAGGAVIVAKTNMSEFAFTVIGANPHFGTPRNPADRARVPGGSSSGAAVAVADGMCEVSIGSDTGGSVRIPAGLCGVVGLKPSRQRISVEGLFPLSFLLDSIGPLGFSVAECAKADAVMSSDEWDAKAFEAITAGDLAGLRFGVAEGFPLEGLDDVVAAAFTTALARLAAANVRIVSEKISLFADMASVNSRGAISPVEAYAIHGDRVSRRGPDIDPNVRERIERAQKITAADYIYMVRERETLVKQMDRLLRDLDALVMPTTAIVAPTIAAISDPGEFGRCNAILLRNAAIGNFFELCAISLPLQATPPVGLMLLARNGQDARLLRIASAVEKLFRA
jgi:aspartyl-tRNA(Asn)/glutamyl-tRNA(Gln) amidotransferase subunit A